MERAIGKNILFLTAVRIVDPEEKGIYTDLLRKFRDEGYHVYVVCPEERRYGGKTRLVTSSGIKILYVRSLNLQKAGLFEKVMATISLSWLLFRAIKRSFKNIKFHLLLYSTPPITFNKAISYLKKRDHAHTYLLLKDIFPQNAVDLKMISSRGILHKYLKRVEMELYELSDFIGCMSEANIDYILKHHPNLSSDRIELNPNSIDLKWLHSTKQSSVDFKKKWGIPPSALVCIYGGNLGKPQGIDFLIEFLHYYKNDERIFFFVIGDGTEYAKINQWFISNQPTNARLSKQMIKSEYDELVQYGDAGLVLLDPRFTIPNFPSRLLTYLENKMSVWAATDVNTDLGKVISENQFGFWVENGELDQFKNEVEKELKDHALNRERGKTGFSFLKNNYSIEDSFNTIVHHFNV